MIITRKGKVIIVATTKDRAIGGRNRTKPRGNRPNDPNCSMYVIVTPAPRSLQSNHSKPGISIERVRLGIVQERLRKRHVVRLARLRFFDVIDKVFTFMMINKTR